MAQIKTWVANTWVKLLQTTGQSTNKAMSQKAVTDSLDSLKSDLVAKANMLSYEEIIASTPPLDLDLAIPKASALKKIDSIVGNTYYLERTNNTNIIKGYTTIFSITVPAGIYILSAKICFFGNGQNCALQCQQISRQYCSTQDETLSGIVISDGSTPLELVVYNIGSEFKREYTYDVVRLVRIK